MKRILIVTTEILKDKYSCSMVTAKVIEELSKVYSVDVITEWTAIFNFNNNINKIELTTKPFLYDFFRTKALKRFFSVNGLDYDKKVRANAFRQILRRVELNNYDHIIAFGGGDNFISHQVLSEFNTSAKLWAYIHDPYPSQVFPYPYKAKESTRNLAELNLFNQVFSKYDKLWFPSTLLAQHMNEFYNFRENQIFVFPHLLPVFDSDNFNADEEDLILAKYGLTKGLFFIHAGTLLSNRKIDLIVKGFSELKNEKVMPTGFKLFFIGNINYEHAHLKDIEKVILVNKRVPYREVNVLCSAAKALIIIEHDGEFSPFLPGKFPEYLALKKPILHFGPYKSEVNQICGYEKKFFSAPLSDLEAIKRALSNGGEVLYDDVKILEHFNLARLIEAFDKL
jgi:hypothetical protein